MADWTPTPGKKYASDQYGNNPIADPATFKGEIWGEDDQTGAYNLERDALPGYKPNGEPITGGGTQTIPSSTEWTPQSGVTYYDAKYKAIDPATYKGEIYKPNKFGNLYKVRDALPGYGTDGNPIGGGTTVNPGGTGETTPSTEPSGPNEPSGTHSGEPVPATARVSADELITFMQTMETPDQGLIKQAQTAIMAAEGLIDAYTRGRYRDSKGDYRAGVRAVVITVSARMLANPGQVRYRDQAGVVSVSRGEGFTGFTLTEKQVLNRYRVTAVG